MVRRAAIVGGGISGLASANRVANLGHQVTLFETENHLGGLGSTFPYRNGHLERFYHCILPNDHALLAFIRELGLEQDLLWRHSGMGFMHQRKIYPLGTPIDLLRFGPLSILDRIRLGSMAVRARFQHSRSNLDQVTVVEWLKGQIGEHAFEILWKPMLEAKLGDRYAQIPALWLFSRMNREKNTGPEIKGTLRGGYRALLDAFQQSLLERDVQMRFKTRVSSIEHGNDCMLLRLDDDEVQPYDFVVVTLPFIQFQTMTAGLRLDPRVANLQLDYQGVINGLFLTEKPLTSYYWMPIVDSGATAQGLIEMSNLMPLERSEGLYVNYLLNYTHRDSAMFRKADDELLSLYRSDLCNLFPDACTTIVDEFLFRAPFVEPIWMLNYEKLRPPMSVIPGRLYLTCTAQVYPSVNSWNSCCEAAEAMVRQLAIETAD